MKFGFLKHPRTGLPDVMATMTMVVVIASAIKFLLDGVSLVINGHTISFGHADSMSYGTLLTPVLGAHSFVNTRPNTMSPIRDGSQEVDNPDAN